MKVNTHLRPREKIALKAVHALSDNELLQLVIGSGTAQFPVSYIARRVQTLLKNGVPSLQTLLQVNGVGEALATRLVAVFEVAKRQLLSTSEQPARVSHPFVEITYLTISNEQLAIAQFDRDEPHALLLQRICTKALLLSASRLSMSFHYDIAPPQSALDDLCLVREARAALALFDVSLTGVCRQWGSYRKELL